MADPRAQLSHFFLTLLSPEFREEFTAIRQIAGLGYDPRDIRHIVLTHLDFERTLLDRIRYRPQQSSRRDQWVIYPAPSGCATSDVREN